MDEYEGLPGESAATGAVLASEANVRPKITIFECMIAGQRVAKMIVLPVRMFRTSDVGLREENFEEQPSFFLILMFSGSTIPPHFLSTLDLDSATVSTTLETSNRAITSAKILPRIDPIR